MSIELTGPKKYKFQDHVCVLLSILAATETDTALQIEPQDGEDALMTLDIGGKKHAVEIQVKGSENAVSADCLADWLAHFPANRSEGSLLERLVSDANCSVLFVASGRCNDATVAYAIPLSAKAISLDKGKIKQKTVANIRTALDEYAQATFSTDKDLAKSRRANIGNELALIADDTLKDALHRVLISEQLNDTEVMRRCREALQALHKVVPDRVDDILSQIESIVFHEKRSNRNILPEVAKIISTGRAKDPLMAASYVRRTEEEALIHQLSLEYAILIKGAPRVGKSFCARSIAATLQSQGYIARVCVDLDEADRFLTEPITGLRVALIDDPFGGAHHSDTAERELQLLEQLIPKLTNGRKLIVAQAQDRLFEVTRLTPEDKIVTAGLTWVTMGIGDSGFLSAVWADAATAYSVPANLMHQVANEIASKNLDLEPGCLVHLAANYSRLEVGAKTEDIVRFARQNSKSFGSALRKDKLAPLLNALAVASTQESHVAEIELAFILDCGRLDRPGESDVIGTISTYGGGSTVRASPLPIYDPPPYLSQQDKDFLEHLELRRILTDNGGMFTFSHPFYRAAAESLLDAATNQSTRAAISLVGRALFTISPDTAKATARNLGWIYKNLNSIEGQQGVIEAAENGLRSIFPMVRDFCFHFLVSRLSSLSNEKQRDVSTWVNKVTATKLSYVEWVDDQPRIPAANIAGALEIDLFPSTIAKQEVVDTLTLLNSQRPDVISNKVTVKALMYLEEHPDDMTIQMAARLLSNDVSLIRALAARAWLRRPRSDDALIVERIFREEHPAVTESAYLGVIASWSLCDDERRRMLTKSMQTMAGSPVAAVVLIGYLVVIAREEYGGKTTPWSLFEAVMPIVLAKLPSGATFRDERLYDVMKSAIGNISKASLLEIIDRWIDSVEEFASRGVPSDYMLGVSSILVSGVSENSGERIKRVERLLAFPGTACRIRVVSDLVDSWDELSEQERTLLLSHLTTDVPDSVWVQAAALTRSTVPTQIQSILLLSQIGLDASPNAVIAKLPSKLLNTCLRVFTGSHPVIYYVGVHGAENSTWEDLVCEIVRIPKHEMFEACWGWLAMKGYSIELARVATELGVDHSERLTSLLLERKQMTSGEFMPEVWAALFELPVSDEVKSEWIVRMVAIAPNVLDSLGECKNWIPKSHRNEFLSHFKEDLNIQNLLFTLRQTLSDIPNAASILGPLSTSVIKLLSHALREAPPRHWSTYDVMLTSLKSLGIGDKSLTKEIEDRRSKGIVDAHNRPDSIVPKLEYWEGMS